MNRDLDRLLDMWALWVINGHMISRGGVFMSESFGGGAGGSGGAVMANDVIETRIEVIVSELGQRDKRAEIVLRVEFGIVGAAGWRDCPRRQLDKAIRLGINLNQYRRALVRARAHVKKCLEVFWPMSVL